MLRQTVASEDLQQFTTRKEDIERDVRESVLGRLTAPSTRLRAVLATDPQAGKNSLTRHHNYSKRRSSWSFHPASSLRR